MPAAKNTFLCRCFSASCLLLVAVCLGLATPSAADGRRLIWDPPAILETGPPPRTFQWQFQPPATLAPTPFAFVAPAIATDGAGNWGVAWINRTSTEGDLPVEGYQSFVRFSRSTDDGATWETAVTLAADGVMGYANHISPVISADGNGNWVVAWSAAASGGRGPDILYTQSADGGAYWSPPAPLNRTAGIPGWSNTAPAIDAGDDGTWLAVWVSRQLEDGSAMWTGDVMVARSQDQGRTWSPPRPLVRRLQFYTPEVGTPVVRSAGNGRWMTAWTANLRDKSREILTSLSVDNGESWHDPEILTPSTEFQIHDHPRLHRGEPGEFLLAWNTYSPRRVEEDCYWFNDGPCWDEVFPAFTRFSAARFRTDATKWRPVWSVGNQYGWPWHDLGLLRFKDFAVNREGDIALFGAFTGKMAWPRNDVRTFVGSQIGFGTSYHRFKWYPVPHGSEIEPSTQRLMRVAVGANDRWGAVWVEGVPHVVHVAMGRESKPSDGFLVSMSPVRHLYSNPGSYLVDVLLDAQVPELVSAAFELENFVVRAMRPVDPPYGFHGSVYQLELALNTTGTGTARVALPANTVVSEDGHWNLPSNEVSFAFNSTPWLRLDPVTEQVCGTGAVAFRVRSMHDVDVIDLESIVVENGQLLHEALEDNRQDFRLRVVPDGYGPVSMQIPAGAAVTVYGIPLPETDVAVAEYVPAVSSDADPEREAASGWSYPFPLSPDFEDRRNINREIVVAAGGYGRWMAAWFEGTRLMFTRSMDNGVTWSMPQIAAFLQDTNRNLSLASNRRGEWILAWESTRRPGFGSRKENILVVRTEDNGETWSDHRFIHATFQSNSPLDIEPDIVFNPVWDSWTVVWRHGTDPEAGIVSSTLHGADEPWGPRVLVASADAFDALSVGKPHVAVTGDGTLVVVWESVLATGEEEAGRSQVWTARSIDGGATWIEARPLYPEGMAAGDFDEVSPRVAADGSRVTAVWTADYPMQDNEPGEHHVFASASVDAGMTWSPPVPVNSDAGLNLSSNALPDVATDSRGRWMVVWESRDATCIEAEDHIYAAESRDHGATWQRRIRMRQGPEHPFGALGNRPRITADLQGQFLSAWETNERLIQYGRRGPIKMYGAMNNSAIPDRPSVHLSKSVGDNTSTRAVTVTAKFSQMVVGLDLSGIRVDNGTAAQVSGSGKQYTFRVTAREEGPVRVQLRNGAAGTLLGGHPSHPSDALEWTYFQESPRPSFSHYSTSSPDPQKFFSRRINFDVPVGGFGIDGIECTNCVLTEIEGSGRQYTVWGHAIEEGMYRVQVLENAAFSLSNGGGSQASQVTFGRFLRQRIWLTGTWRESEVPHFEVQVQGNPPVNSLAFQNVRADNGLVARSTLNSRAASVFPRAPGPVVVHLDNVESLIPRNLGYEVIVEPLYLEHVPEVTDPPEVVLSSDAPNEVAGPFDVEVAFSREVVDFRPESVAVARGRVTAFAGSGEAYRLVITPTVEGTVSVSMAEGAVQDRVGIQSLASAPLQRQYVRPPEPLRATLILAADYGPTNAREMDFAVFFNRNVVGFDHPETLHIEHSGTSHESVQIGFGPRFYYVRVLGLEGEGHFTLAVRPDSSIRDYRGEPLSEASASAPVFVDTVSPVISSVHALPGLALPGGTVQVRFTSSEPLSSAPVIGFKGLAPGRIGPLSMPDKGSEGLQHYGYQIFVESDAPPGPVGVQVVATDLAGNVGVAEAAEAFTVLPQGSPVPVSPWPVVGVLAVLGLVAAWRRRRS